jgi:hypothetical protein
MKVKKTLTMLFHRQGHKYPTLLATCFSYLRKCVWTFSAWYGLVGVRLCTRDFLPCHPPFPTMCHVTRV